VRHHHEMQPNQRRRGRWEVGVLGVVASACLIGASNGVQAASTGTPIHLASVTMQSTTVGWGIDRHLGGQLVHSVDGGRTWTNVTPPGVTFDEITNATQDVNAPPSPPHNTVTWYQSGSTARTATLISRSANGTGVVLMSETADGGRHWHQWTVHLPDLNEGSLIDPILGQLDFVNADHGWLIVGPGYGSFAGMDYVGMELWHTTTGGHTWTRVDEISGRSGIMVDALTFTSATVGWIMESKIDHNPILRHTRDAGRTWSRVALAGVVPDSTPIFHGATGVLFVGKQNRIDHLEVLESTDAGQRWGAARGIPLPTSVFVGLKASPINSQVIWDLAGHRLWRTVNGGRTWTVQSRAMLLTHNPFLDVVNQRAVWAWDFRVGGPSTMASTTDGGHTWTSWTPALVP